jgi:hypothetical protein
MIPQYRIHSKHRCYQAIHLLLFELFYDMMINEIVKEIGIVCVD